ncbi:hypothetical protein CQA57_06975 [Helicobacter anseris]|uniref:Uncharacterized protein n=1 Tax=Helicobacter anseris TaxID=375926 RepID=A0A3D8J4E1_9HELI|nr:hypothetical protein [Helicobacter anseris]RDU72338.1 hypothetical protein CQA57_06975 [Helicobacter anseris]
MKNKLKVIKIKLKERDQVDVNINPKMWGYLYNLNINHLKEDLCKLTNEYIIIGIYFGDFKTQREAKEFHNTILKNPKAFLEFDYKQRKILLNGKECCYFFRFYHNACDDLKQTKLTTSIDRQLLTKIDNLFWNEKNKGKEDLGFDFFYMQIKNITLKQVKSIANAKAKERNTEANGGEMGEEFFGLDNVAYYFEIGDNEKIEIPKYYYKPEK